ncbi:hypothetical protein [Sphingomonas sp.]|uniref:hypothetical protein n=1 Tax=Sphingomonas sp. TaxID=28214 RepID=UPI0035A8AF2F
MHGLFGAVSDGRTVKQADRAKHSVRHAIERSAGISLGTDIDLTFLDTNLDLNFLAGRFVDLGDGIGRDLAGGGAERGIDLGLRGLAVGAYRAHDQPVDRDPDQAERD